jgi:hypothetical protein
MRLAASQIETELTKFVSQDVESIARSTQFVQRESPFNGRTFLQTVVFGYAENPEASLNDLAQVSGDLGVQISAQGIDQRITEQALSFMKQMFSRALEQFKARESLSLGLLKHFNGVYLTDSSVEFLRHHLTQVVLRAGRDADQSYQDYVQVLEEGALSITDLGYFSLSVFKTIIHDCQAYVLSRLDTQVSLFTPDGVEIDLLDLAQRCGHEAFEMDVLVGKSANARLPFRLLAFPVPQEVADQRRRKAKENACRKGRTVSQRHLALLSWSFFITNAPLDQLPLTMVTVLYRVRWQVELLFKLCKSYCGLKRVAGFRRERILVELYGKLIGVVLTHFLLAPLRMPEGPCGRREISPVKTRKIFRRFIRDLTRAMGYNQQVQDVLSQLLTHIERFAFKEKRTKEPNLCHRLALVSAACGFEPEESCLA